MPEEMPEETPQLPVSETASRPAFGESKQETQIQAPSLLKKISAQKKKILIGLGSLLAVLIIAGAVFGAYRLGQRQAQPDFAPTPTPTAVATPIPTQEVTITTDKVEYEQGEMVKMVVTNGLGKSVWRDGECGGFFFWGLQKLESGEWKRLDFSLPYLEKEKEFCDFILCERAAPVEFKSGSELSYDWRLNICEWPEKPIGDPKTEPKRIKEGIYRISFTYGLNKEGFDLLEKKTIYSNEFTIREKEFSRSECKGVPDGASCTVGLWYDELGRACGGQSCVGLGMGGACYKGECVYLEEYENLVKNPQTECLGSCRCMKECNKKGANAYFSPVEEGAPECSVNSLNKICCCPGI